MVAEPWGKLGPRFESEVPDDASNQINLRGSFAEGKSAEARGSFNLGFVRLEQAVYLRLEMLRPTGPSARDWFFPFWY
jgi:hypothetical protein